MKQKIIQFFKDYIYSPSSLRKRIKQAPKQYLEFCQDILNKIPQWQKISFVIIGLCKNQQLLHCKECGQILDYHSISCGRVFCSKKCANSNKIQLQKKKNSNIQKYGSSVYWNSKEFRDKKFRQNHYYNVSQTEKYKRTRSNTAYKHILENWSKYVIPLFTQEDFFKSSYKTKLKWKCQKCGKEFLSHIHATKHISKSNPKLRKVPRCLDCYPFDQTNGTSYMEKELAKFCKQYFPNLKENNREIIHPLEIDILIEDIKLAIEFNGCYHHSLQKSSFFKGYQLTKTQMVQSKGYRLIHVWQDDWTNNKEEIKKKLIDIFENKEIIDYSKMLERDWYPLMEIQGYNLEVLPPQIKIRNSYHCQNSGYLKYSKI